MAQTDIASIALQANLALPNVSGAHNDVQLLELWLRGRRSEHTRRYYRRFAEMLLIFAAVRGHSLRDLTVTDVHDFIETLPGVEASRGTATRAIRSLLSYGHRTGYLIFNVGLATDTPTQLKTLAEPILSEAEVHQMLATAKKLRNKVLLRVLYASGMRRSELCRLRWRDVQPRDDAGQVVVCGKGNRVRSILLPKGTWEALMELRHDCCAKRGGVDPDPEDPVFRSQKGGALDPSAVLRIVKKAAKQAGISVEVSPHFLRHAHASHALERGAPIQLVQATLGHSSVATTGGYLHARPTDSSARVLAV